MQITLHKLKYALICWSEAQETFIVIINVENSCAPTY